MLYRVRMNWSLGWIHLRSRLKIRYENGALSIQAKASRDASPPKLNASPEAQTSLDQKSTTTLAG